MNNFCAEKYDKIDENFNKSAFFHAELNILDLWRSYGDILWENGKHKNTCCAFLHEIHEIARKYAISTYDNAFLDILIAEFRKKGNRNSTINRKMASLSKLLRKHHKNGWCGWLLHPGV